MDRLAILAALWSGAWCIACNGQPGESESKPVVPKPESASSTSTSLPAPVDAPPVMLQLSVPAGSTNVGTSPRINFGIVGLLPAFEPWLKKYLSECIAFVGDDGFHSAPEVTIDATPNTGYSHVIQVSPLTELRADTWYWMRIDPAGKLRISDGTTVSKERVATAFFTGSAPRVVRIDHSETTAEAPLTIRFSEPVELGAASSSLQLQFGTSRARGCLAWMGRCVSKDSTVINNAAEYQFSGTWTRGEDPIQLAAGDALAGSSRTLAQARAAGAFARAAVSQTIAPSDWKRTADGRTTFWVAEMPELPE